DALQNAITVRLRFLKDQIAKTAGTICTSSKDCQLTWFEGDGRREVAKRVFLLALRELKFIRCLNTRARDHPISILNGSVMNFGHYSQCDCIGSLVSRR